METKKLQKKLQPKPRNKIFHDKNIKVATNYSQVTKTVTQTWPELNDKIQCNVDNSDNAAVLPGNLKQGKQARQ